MSDPVATSRAELEPRIDALIAGCLSAGMKSRRVTIPWRSAGFTSPPLAPRGVDASRPRDYRPPDSARANRARGPDPGHSPLT